MVVLPKHQSTIFDSFHITRGANLTKGPLSMKEKKEEDEENWQASSRIQTLAVLRQM